MSRATCKPTSYDAPVNAELERWPGVTFTREVRSKHYALVLKYEDQSRFVVYPSSPSDNIRGVLNHIQDVRAVLRSMGATRVVESKKATIRARRPKTKLSEPIKHEPFKTRLSDNPFEKLAQIRFEEHASPPSPASRIERLMTWFRTWGQRP